MLLLLLRDHHMDATDRLVQKERAVFDNWGRLEVFLHLQHNFKQHMPRKQTQHMLIFDMLKHICEKAVQPAAHHRHPRGQWRERRTRARHSLHALALRAHMPCMHA